jgi:hypothetical protein
VDVIIGFNVMDNTAKIVAGGSLCRQPEPGKHHGSQN